MASFEFARTELNRVRHEFCVRLFRPVGLKQTSSMFIRHDVAEFVLAIID